MNGHVVEAGWLLNQCTNLATKDNRDNTVLHMLSDAVPGNRAGEPVDLALFARMLIARGAPLGARNSPFEFTPLDLARYAGRDSLVRELQAAGAPSRWPKPPIDNEPKHGTSLW